MRTLIVRHGESLGNIDPTVYGKLGNHKVPLTQWGYEQSHELGQIIRQHYDSHPHLAGKAIRIWLSPYLRAVQTKEALVNVLGPDRIESVRESFLLREQDYGLFSDVIDDKSRREKFPEEARRFENLVQTKGKIYARPPNGECRADVALRTDFFIDNKLLRSVDEGQEDHLIISHGVVNRALQMLLLNLNAEWFENAQNPRNCEATLIEGDARGGYRSTLFNIGKDRIKSLPKDFRTAAHGGQEIS